MGGDESNPQEDEAGQKFSHKGAPITAQAINFRTSLSTIAESEQTNAFYKEHGISQAQRQELRRMKSIMRDGRNNDGLMLFGEQIWMRQE